MPPDLARALNATVHLDWTVLTALRAAACILAAAVLVRAARGADARRSVWALALLGSAVIFAVGLGAAAQSATSPAADWIAVVWLTGFLVAAGRIVLGLALLSRLRRRSQRIEAPDREMLIDTAHAAIGLRQRADVRVSRETTTPIAFGWRRPCVVLPSEAESWTDERVSMVLLHELAHIQRRDWRRLVGERLVAAIYWFHPGVRWCARRHRVETELACDNAVLAVGVSAISYASHVIALASANSSRRLPAASAFVTSEGTILQERISAILGARTDRERRSGARLPALVLAIVVTFSVVVTTPVSVCPITGRVLGVASEPGAARTDS